MRRLLYTKKGIAINQNSGMINIPTMVCPIVYEFYYFDKIFTTRYLRSAIMAFSYKNHASQWLKEAMALHCSTTLEISRQINVDKKRPDPREAKLRKAYQTLKALDLFLDSSGKMQTHTPKVHQQLFQRLENLYLDLMVKTVFNHQLNTDYFLGHQSTI